MIQFGEAYTEQLLESYPQEIVAQITNPQEVRYADLPHQPGESIGYIRVRFGEDDQANPGRRALYIPGFTEGVVAKAPFAAAMAERGVDITVPDQNRVAMLRDAANKRSATESQARNYLAVMQAEGMHSKVDFITHSYGALILNRMAKLAPEVFADSRVVMLAPAGFSKESPVGLGVRFAKNLIQENKSAKEFPDPNGEMFRAGMGHSQANIPRTVLEVWDLLHDKVDYKELLTLTTGRVAVQSYGHDALFSQDVLYPGMQQAVEAGVRWSIPVRVGGEQRGPIDGATHNDEQFNPSRVAGSVAQVLATQAPASR